MARIEVRDVEAAYSQGPVLENVSFVLGRGEFVGLIGPNGAGKSTLIRVASGALKARRGSVLIDGIEVGSIPRLELARRLAVVRQEQRLEFDFTVAEIVAMGRIPHLGRFQSEGPGDQRIVEEALERTGLSPLSRRLVTEISGGERQRAAVARALAQQPEILLLDEPTAHLDIAFQLSILDLLGRLAREEGLAVLAVLHDLNLASQHCQRLLLLDSGRLFSDGEPAAVLRRDSIREVFGIEAAILPHPVSGVPCVHPLLAADEIRRTGGAIPERGA